MTIVNWFFAVGEVSEWLKEPVSKTGIPLSRDRGFESHPLRESPPRADFRIKNSEFSIHPFRLKALCLTIIST